MRLRSLALGMLLSVCACASPGITQPLTYAYYAQPLAPEGWYEDLHVFMEKCAKRTRDYDGIQWFIVKHGAMGGVTNDDGTTNLISGLWSSPNRIYLDEAFVHNEYVIKHELLHYITSEGNSAHAKADFMLCAGII